MTAPKKAAAGAVVNPYAKMESPTESLFGGGWNDEEAAEQVDKYETALAMAMLNSLKDVGPNHYDNMPDGDKKPAAVAKKAC